MDNVAKALIIAGGMLLTIALFTFMGYLYRKMWASSYEIYSTLDDSEITEFNQQFLNYDGKDNLSIQDVVTISNLARDNNERGTVPITVKVTLKLSTGGNYDVNGETDLSKLKVSELNDLISTKLKDSTEYQYSCTVSYETDSKLINSVVLEETV